ncbi:hypothetical protein [Bdellovibrio sp. HCB209]|uniref:hypothetical protein n=1 Tax=Bdellovibrio sp. HCB209 TaxID=3394354 RepID=UPI0039B5045C
MSSKKLLKPAQKQMLTIEFLERFKESYSFYHHSETRLTSTTKDDIESDAVVLFYEKLNSFDCSKCPSDPELINAFAKYMFVYHTQSKRSYESLISENSDSFEMDCLSDGYNEDAAIRNMLLPEILKCIEEILELAPDLEESIANWRTNPSSLDHLQYRLNDFMIINKVDFIVRAQIKSILDKLRKITA